MAEKEQKTYSLDAPEAALVLAALDVYCKTLFSLRHDNSLIKAEKLIKARLGRANELLDKLYKWFPET